MSIKRLQSFVHTTHPAVQYVLACATILLCWLGVSWALKPESYLVADEIGNLTRFLGVPYWQAITVLPQAIYNDRPVGFAFEKLLFDHYGFQYTGQVVWLFAIHFANCGMGFLLFRRLGVGPILSLAGIAIFGSLWTTADTATYLGAVFDVTCLFFFLASVLVLLWGKRGASVMSALLFFAALRSKEIALVIPLLLTIVVVLRSRRSSPWQSAVEAGRRLWMHYLIALAVGLRYASFVPRMRTLIPADNLYYMQVDLATALKSLSYYTALIFGAETSILARLPAAIALGLAAIFLYAVVRRRAGLAFGVAAYVLTLLPVSFLPNIRAEFYVYGPQMFLILVLCLLVEELLAGLSKRESLRWAATVCIALGCMWWSVRFQTSQGLRNRIAFTRVARAACLKTARSVTAQLASLQPGAHIYVNHGRQTPWLFSPGPCDFMRVAYKQRSVTCFLQEPEAELRNLFARDEAPKYFLDYCEDGSVVLTGSAAGIAR